MIVMMTKFMKFEAVCYYILKAFYCFCGFVGFFGLIGFAGSHERAIINAAQYWMYELHAICLIGLAWVVYQITQLILADFDYRVRCQQRKLRARAQRQRAYQNRYNH